MDLLITYKIKQIKNSNEFTYQALNNCTVKIKNNNVFLFSCKIQRFGGIHLLNCYFDLCKSLNQELILDYCFYLKKRLFISEGSFIVPAPTDILHLKCCISKTRIFLSDRRRNVCINYFIPPVKNVFYGPYILCRNTGSFYFTKTMQMI